MTTDRLVETLGESRDAATQRVIERMRKYVEMESPSRSVGHIRALAGVISADIRTAGADVELIDAPEYGAHIVGRMGDDAREHIAILSHMDTVHPVGTLASQPFRV